MKIQDRRTGRKIPKRPGPVWGVCLHTTGGGVVKSAVKHGTTPLDEAVKYYLSLSRGGPAYVIGYDAIAQVADEDQRTEHVGSYGPNHELRRDQYMSGEWLKLAPAKAVALWKKAWPMKKHPWQLFPSKGPNSDFVGVEMTPQANKDPQGLLFSPWQHDAAVDLCIDIARRHKFPDRWWTTSRLVGHEDVGLLDRSTASGSWDPGFLRDKPYFDFAYVRSQISKKW